VVLQWAQGNVDGYEICRATSAGGDYEVVGTAAGGTVTTYTDKRLTCGKTYYYKIRQYRTINGGKVYGELSDYVKAKPVPKAVKIKKLKASKGKITITWKKQAKAYGYEIYRSTKASAKGSKIASVKGTVKYIDTKKIKKKKTYYYRVRAYQLVKGKKVYGAYSEAKKINGR
jgi:fibronectin type 3 domain-containing protein